LFALLFEFPRSQLSPTTLVTICGIPQGTRAENLEPVEPGACRILAKELERLLGSPHGCLRDQAVPAQSLSESHRLTNLVN